MRTDNIRTVLDFLEKNPSKGKTIKKLKKGKTYWFRVRAYRTVTGTDYYGAWSKAKKVKIR